MHQKSWRQFWPPSQIAVATPWKKVSSSTIRTSKEATKYFQRHSYHHPVYYCPAKISKLNDFSSATQLWMNDVVIPSITVFKNSLKKSHQNCERHLFSKKRKKNNYFVKVNIEVRHFVQFSSTVQYVSYSGSFYGLPVLFRLNKCFLVSLLLCWQPCFIPTDEERKLCVLLYFFSGAPSLLLHKLSPVFLLKASSQFSFPAFHV